MVRDEEKQLIRQCVDALREGIPGFRSRRPQMEMIAAVANTLSRCRAEDEQAGNGDHLAIVEAGTGTGKSFGALVPALVMAKSRNKHLVVSSSTVALQHQYAEKDAPSSAALAPDPFHLCRRQGPTPLRLYCQAAGRRQARGTGRPRPGGRERSSGGYRRRTPAGGRDAGVAGHLRHRSLERGSRRAAACPWSMRFGSESPRIARGAPAPSVRSSHAVRSRPRGRGSRRQTS